MAANAQAFQNILTNINFGAGTRAAIAQNVEDVSELRGLTMEEVDKIGKSVREPGGTIPNPVYAATEAANAAAVAAGNADGVVDLTGIPQTIRNPGLSFGVSKMKLMRQLWFFCHHRHYHLSLPDPDGATITNAAILITTFRFYTQWEANKDKDPTMPSKYDPKKLKETLDGLTECFASVFGAVGVPLSYVVRQNAAVPAAGDRANLGTEWGLLVACTRHDGRFWNIDNAAVWKIMYQVFFETEGWTWISSFQASQNGRGAFLAFQTHYLGGGTQNLLLQNAKELIRDITYNGESRSFTFENYVSLHKKAHEQIEQYGDAEDRMSNKQKVTALKQGIQCDQNVTMQAALAVIEANPAQYEANFDLTANFIKRQMRVAVNPRQGRQISEAGPGGAGRGGGRGRGRGRRAKFAATDNLDIDISARDYSDDEWYSLSFNQQNQVRTLRGEPTLPHPNKKRSAADTEQADSEQADPEQGDSEQGDSEQGDSKRQATTQTLRIELVSVQPPAASDGEHGNAGGGGRR